MSIRTPILLLCVSSLVGGHAVSAEFKPADPGLAIESVEAAKPRYASSQTYYVAEIDGMPQLQNGRTIRHDRMRRAEPKLRPHLLFLRTDPAMATRFSDPAQAPSYAYIELEIDDAGKVAACRAEATRGSKPDTGLVDAQCPLLRTRALFHSALDLEGNPVSDVYTISIRFTHGKEEGGARPRAIRQPPEMLTVAMPPPSFDKAASWPLESWMMRYSNIPTFKMPPVSGVGQSPITANEPVTGLVISKNVSGEIICNAVTGTENIKRNKAACDLVLKKMQPSWPVNAHYFSTQYPLLVVGEGKKMRAIAPLPDSNWRLSLSAEQAAQTIKLLEGAMQPGDKIDNLLMWLEVSSDGAVAGCKIGKSAGSDAGDVGACRAMRDHARFLPGLDVFGQPLPLSEGGWTVKWAKAVVAQNP